MIFLACAQAQDQAPVSTSVHRSYLMQLDRWGNANFPTLVLDQNEKDNRIGGSIDCNHFVDISKGNDFVYTATAADKSTYTYHATRSKVG